MSTSLHQTKLQLQIEKPFDHLVIAPQNISNRYALKKIFGSKQLLTDSSELVPLQAPINQLLYSQKYRKHSKLFCPLSDVLLC